MQPQQQNSAPAAAHDVRVAVDARPLTQSFNGIGHYLFQVLDHLLTAPRDPDVQWLLYSDAPIELPSHWQNTTARTGSISSRLIGVAFAQLTFGRWAHKDNANVYWSPRHQLPIGLPGNIPAVVTLHDLVFKNYPETMSRFGRYYEALFTPAALRRAHRIITTSRAVRSELIETYPGCEAKSQAIALGSNLTAGECQQDSIPNPYAVFIGSMEPRKNLVRLIKAFKQLNDESAEPLSLAIISGGGWNNAGTLELIEQNKDILHYHHQATTEQKATLVNNAAFLALPSLYEGFGLPIVEAQKMGIPVLTSNRGAMREVAGNGAIYIDPESTSDIVRGLRMMFTDHQLRADLAENAKISGAQYSWQTCANETLKTLRQASIANPGVPT